MSFVVDGFWVESEDGEELIVPSTRPCRSDLNVLDDWSGMSQDEKQKIIEDCFKKNVDKIMKKYGDLIGQTYL